MLMNGLLVDTEVTDAILAQCRVLLPGPSLCQILFWSLNSTVGDLSILCGT